MLKTAVAVLAVMLAGCSGADSASDGGVAGPDAGSDQMRLPDGGLLRDSRYCEILFVGIDGGAVHVEVYSTQGLNDCPAQQWAQQDTAALKADSGAAGVVLNGPRQWTIDSLGDSKLIDAAVKSFGGIAMRQAGAIELTLTQALSLQAPYTPRTITRNSTFIFAAGLPVYELTAPDARVYTMQSYSLQKAPLTAAELPGLSSRLALPAGWSFKSRTLSATLTVRAVEGKATVVQDDLSNTYLQSQ